MLVRLASTTQSDRAGCAEALVDDPIRPDRGSWGLGRCPNPTWAVGMSRVSGGFLSAQVVQRRFQRWHDEGEVLEWLGGTMSPSMAKQVRIPGESSGGSGEAPVRFKVVSEEWCAAADVARPPRA